MADSQNLTNLKAVYSAWGMGGKTANLGSLEAMMADNFRIASVDEKSPGMAFAVDRHSKEASIGYLKGIFDEWEMIHFTPKTFLEDGDHIAMFGMCKYRHKKTGKDAECHISALWEFKDGKVVSLTDIFDSAKAAAAATP
jgi:ketosteroid isomerase-like protein